MSEFTKGEWKVAKYGTDLGVYEGDSERPLFKSVKPKNYYTDWPKRIDEDGIKWDVLSTEQAKKEGRHVATDELRAEIEAEELKIAHLIAASPDMYEALKYCLSTLEDDVKPIRWSDSQYRDAAIEQAEKALAKAEGKNNE